MPEGPEIRRVATRTHKVLAGREAQGIADSAKSSAFWITAVGSAGGVGKQSRQGAVNAL